MTLTDEKGNEINEYDRTVKQRDQMKNKNNRFSAGEESARKIIYLRIIEENNKYGGKIFLNSNM
ncbi:MAG: hypothetical protein ACP5IB_08410 [Thermoplasmata archaeon]